MPRSSLFVPFDPPPLPKRVPSVFPTPFAQGLVHPLARAAAIATQQFIEAHPEIDTAMVRGPLGGKMFGVVVVQMPDAQIGYLRGFAGMLGGRRDVPGFVPPVFDTAQFERLWTEHGQQICALNEEIETRSNEHTSETDPNRLHALIQDRKTRSAALLPLLQGTYQIRNSLGESATLAELFDPRPPPGGSGDCAAPKLLAHAFSVGARPVALAEFWWGDSTPAGGRHHGLFYPACRGKCGKILPFMLKGLPCEPPPEFGNHCFDAQAPSIVFEDDHLLVVNKPSGLLSVPGRGAARRDCVQSRLQQRSNGEPSDWPRLVHRLDQATSGLLIAAKAKPSYVAIQRQFSSRCVEKRYVAVLAKKLETTHGLIELPIGPDLDDRPRQIHDPVHGKPCVTRWERLRSSPDTTRVAFFPETEERTNSACTRLTPAAWVPQLSVIHSMVLVANACYFTPSPSFSFIHTPKTRCDSPHHRRSSRVSENSRGVRTLPASTKVEAPKRRNTRRISSFGNKELVDGGGVMASRDFSDNC